MFAIEMLPAGNGDSLWVEYSGRRKVHRLLIDGGTAGTAEALRQRIERLDLRQRRFDLLVVTHIDTDHIDGILRLLQYPPEGLAFDQIWFNGYRQARAASPYLAPLQGELLSAYLERQERDREGLWNGAFDGKAIVVPDRGPLPVRELDGGLRLTVLAPGQGALAALADDWQRVIADLGAAPGDSATLQERLAAGRRDASRYLSGLDVEELARQPFVQDTAPANGSSIVLLAEWEGLRCLLPADAFPSAILRGLERLQASGRVQVSALKLPHHGSRANNCTELYQKLDCPSFLVSTDGTRYHHPDAEGIARLLLNKRGAATLFFNYRSPYSAVWDFADTKNSWNFACRFGTSGALRVEL